MGMIILLFLSVFLEFPPFLLTLDKAYVTKPFHLTGANISNVFVPYFAFDQCKPYHSITHDPKVESRNFGLYFLTKHQGGYCDDGILICYPGTLMRNHMIDEFKNMSEFKVKRTFQVGNKKNDSLSLKCAQKTEQFVGLTDPEQWRGIKVYTKLTNSSNPLSTRELILETSLTNRSYTFEPMTRQFSLNFGTRISLFTWVTTHFGQPFDDEEFNTAEQYAKQMGQGPFMEEHVGLWLLGMDMLPWMAEEYVSLYVYRSCSCTMDAWFTRPTDENDPIEPIVPSAGSSQCQMKQMDETFELGQLDAQHLQADLVFTVLTDEDWQNFTVEFLSGETNLTSANSTDNNATVVMIMTIGTTDDMEVSFPGMGTTVVNGTQMANGTQELRFDIFLLEHWFVIMVNGKQLGDVFWPNEWWHGEAWKNITAIRLNGQMLLLFGPELDAYGIENENFNFSVPLPFSTGINGLHENSSCFFRVQMLNVSEPKLLTVNFTNDKSASDLATFSIILYNNGTSFNTSFNNDTSFNTLFNNDTSFNNDTIVLKVELRVFYDGKWLENEHRNATITFKNISVFELFFGITKGNDVIKLNGVQMFEDYSNSAPYCDMKKIEVTGDAILLLDEPELNVTPPKEKTGSEISNFALQNVVNYGRKIIINSKEQLIEGAKIVVRLTHNSPDCSKFDIVAQFEFIVNSFDQTGNCKHKLRKEGNVAQLNDAEDSYTILMVPEVPLNLEILMGHDAFYAQSSVPGRYVKLCPYYLPINLTEMRTPPWTIDHVQVWIENQINEQLKIANVTLNVSMANALSNSTKALTSTGLVPMYWEPIDYVKINKSFGSDGDSFTVLITLPLAKMFMKMNENAQVQVAFFNQALENHEIFGTNLLNIKVDRNQLVFRKWSNKDWTEHGNFTLDFPLAQESGTNQTELRVFEMSFTIMLVKGNDRRFRPNFALDGQIINAKNGREIFSPANLTTQDVQYITVSHSDIELAPGQKIKMSCTPAEEKCTQ